TKDQLLKDGFVVNTILKEADLFCPNSVRINFTIYLSVQARCESNRCLFTRRICSKKLSNPCYERKFKKWT
ncbi:hypothetical protein EFP16_16355, partial [Lactiplantibacillus pentosus]|nr:hypothetical protein [Lactiplantibacillus pentosus]